MLQEIGCSVGGLVMGVGVIPGVGSQVIPGGHSAGGPVILEGRVFCGGAECSQEAGYSP